MAEPVIPTYIHDPAAILDYRVDWSSWLDAGETITASTWSFRAGITQASPAPSHTTSEAVIWLTGGTPRQAYRVTNHITTSAGRQDQRSFRVSVVDR